MPRNDLSRSRTPRQAAADRHADELTKRAGRAIFNNRKALHRTQAASAALAGLSRSRYADLEVRADGGVTVRALSRAAMAAGGELHLYIKEASAADQPRDAVHLRHQELIVRTAATGGWLAFPEEPIDRAAATSRAADVLLNRAEEWALQEVWDWFLDVGAAFRDWDRRLAAVERLAISRMAPPGGLAAGDPPLPRVSGCWVVRATSRNRQLVADHRHLFRARFPGPAQAWLAALTTPSAMPSTRAVLWVTVDGSRLYPSRL